MFDSYQKIGYDLAGCLEYNPQADITEDTIAAVLAVWEGENDGDDWRWVVEMTDGRFAFIQGGCDFTGWDCQSWATSAFADTAETAAMYALGVDLPAGTILEPQGLGHMLSMLLGDYMGNGQAVLESLWGQVQAGREETWREKMDKEFGLT